nr:GyrI-like domain-containing protein [Dietzia sp. DQ11-38-2]
MVQVPSMRFLMADGRGDPNTCADYATTLEALYTCSYAVRAMAKDDLGRVHTVGPLEGLWYARDLEVFTARNKDAWEWTMMIWQPDWVTADMVASAVDKVTARKPAVAVDRVRLEEFAEGPAVQTLHVGPYDAEGPVIARMHEEIIPGRGLIPTGHHHEIYLSDARRTDPARLRTILRQPVATAGEHGSGAGRKNS